MQKEINTGLTLEGSEGNKLPPHRPTFMGPGRFDDPSAYRDLKRFNVNDILADSQDEITRTAILNPNFHSDN